LPSVRQTGQRSVDDGSGSTTRTPQSSQTYSVTTTTVLNKLGGKVVPNVPTRFKVGLNVVGVHEIIDEFEEPGPVKIGRVIAELSGRDELDGVGRRHDLPGGEFGPPFDYEFRGTAGTRR